MNNGYKIKRNFISIILSAIVIFGAVFQLTAKAESSGIPQYRLYFPKSGKHFYSTDPQERDQLIQGGWTYEGIMGLTPASSDAPVFRLYNLISEEHHYTTNQQERAALAALDYWNEESIGWYSGGDMPVYRLFNPAAPGVSAHHYTSDTNERDALTNNGWNYEGIAWYVSSAQGFVDPNPAPEIIVPEFDPADVTAVGDSVMLGAVDALRATFPGCVVDAAVSRQARKTLATLQSLESRGLLKNTVILAVGTNGPFTESVGQEIVDYLGPDRRIYWVNVYGPSISWATSSNNTIRVIADKNDNVTLLDWNSEGAAHPDWFYSDKIHLRPAGRLGYAQFISKKITDPAA